MHYLYITCILYIIKIIREISGIDETKLEQNRIMMNIMVPILWHLTLYRT